MINIKDKLNRTNILIKRPNNVDVEYVPSYEFEADIKAVNDRIDELEYVDTSDYVTKSEFNNQIDELKLELASKKIDATGFNFSKCTFSEFPDIFDFSNVSNFDYMFSYCDNLTTINVNLDSVVENTREWMFGYDDLLLEAPEIDTTLTTSMQSMYSSCESLTKAPSYNVDVCKTLYGMYHFCKSLVEVGDFITNSGHSELKDVARMFYDCTSLVTAPNIPTKNVTDFYHMFNGCTALETVPEYDASSANSIDYMFTRCNNLKNFGGLKNLKIDWNVSGACLDNSSKITYESIINVINGLYDFRGNGDSDTTRTIKIHYLTMRKLKADDIAMATAKGWVISSN